MSRPESRRRAAAAQALAAGALALFFLLPGTAHAHGFPMAVWNG